VVWRGSAGQWQRSVCIYGGGSFDSRHLAALVLGEQIGWVQIVGVATVILAIFVLTFPERTRARTVLTQ